MLVSDPVSPSVTAEGETIFPHPKVVKFLCHLLVVVVVG